LADANCCNITDSADVILIVLYSHKGMVFFNQIILFVTGAGGRGKCVNKLSTVFKSRPHHGNMSKHHIESNKSSDSVDKWNVVDLDGLLHSRTVTGNRTRDTQPVAPFCQQ